MILRPLTGKVILEALDENDGMDFLDLQSMLYRNRICISNMDLLVACRELILKGLMCLEGHNIQELIEEVRRNDYYIMYGLEGIWRTTPAWHEFSTAVFTGFNYSQDSSIRIGAEHFPIFDPAGLVPSLDIFVVMPFTPSMTAIYKDHLKRVCGDLGLEAMRADDFFNNRMIIKDVWDSINSATAVIADCSNRNPNVFYELGLAHSVGKAEVLMIASDEDDIPSDLRHLRYIVYEYTPRGMQAFEKTLEMTLRTVLNLPLDSM